MKLSLFFSFLLGLVIGAIIFLILVVIINKPVVCPPTTINFQVPTKTPIVNISPVSDKSDGYYMVGSEIATGNWRTEKGYPKCYWEVDDKNGKIVDNYMGNGGGVVFVKPENYQVKFQDCGTVKLLK
jgi:hypothetical protein